ncbi:MAG: ornithine carbamoyltransferase [Pelagibacterales bacterium]|jgi:ornithine carbamoyltransferase|nr:ornithine carbamoyltransferase [Pelagibacterales bacterium]MCH2678635.1 ornithine carbamoyltransferase [Alphaproteobacteria bacterium]|tara:strand:- start:3093 stop:4007 length:915 start_codon:yes stop_codon:yes gene_type:complete
MRNLIDINMLNDGIARKLLQTAKFYKSSGRGLLEGAPLLGRTLAMIFEKPSTRTRISFEVAMTELGGSAIYLDAKSMQMGRGETIADTAKVLGRYLDGIMIRASKHETLLEMAKHSKIPVINGLTDISHPCQILADIMTFEEKLGDIENKTISWVGDGNNMANSWIHASKIFNFKLRLACPSVRLPDENIVKWAKDNGANIKIMNDPMEACKDSNAILTDTWVSMGDENTVNPEKIFNNFQVNDKLFAVAADDAIFMHCLPAHRGQEVSSEIIDGPRSVVWDEAENRLHIQKAILSWAIADKLI